VEEATGYILNIGTTSGGVNILEDFNVGDVTTYFPNNLPCGSDIFVSIIPYNSFEKVTSCNEENFRTEKIIANAGDDRLICFGDSCNLQANGGVIYKWESDDGLNNLNISNPIASPKNTTTFIVTVKNESGQCLDTDSVTIEIQKLEINLDSIHDVRTNQLGNISVTLKGSDKFIFQWSGPENYSSSSEDIYNLSNAGCYSLIITDTMTFCRIDTTFCIADKTNIFDNIFDNQIKIYPNPVIGNFTVDFSNADLSKINMSIIDISGRIIKSILKQEKKDQIEINVNSIKSGLYLIRIQVDNDVLYRKIVID
jgi:hypothetical protein